MSLTAIEVLETMKEIINSTEIIEICEKWRDEHKVKTYADVFFEQFPNAERFYGNKKIPIVEFRQIYGGEIVSIGEDVKLWLQPYPKELED